MKRNFDEAASTWDQNPFRLKMALAIADRIAEALELRADQTLLDYGAGTGVVALKLAPAVNEVLCADGSKGMLEVLESKIRSAGASNLRTLLLDLERHPAGAELPRVDVLVSSMTLHHIADTASLARRFFAMVNRGGQIAIADLDSEAGDFHDDNTGVEHFGFDRARVQELFAQAGFESLATRTAYTMTKTTTAGIDKTFSIFLLTGKRK